MAQKGAAPVSAPPSPAEYALEMAETRASKRVYYFFKRALDITLASLLFLLFLPLIAIVAIAIKIDSPGPILLRQTRVGRDGRHFGCFKFRSMRPDAEKLQRELEGLNERNGPIFKIKDDPRITRLGRFLRKYSIDEIPQLLNVVRGEMSMVGPRPPLPKEVAKYEPHHFRRLEVTPGLTGLWQVTARDHKDFEVWVQLDVRYIDSQSFWLDLWILMRTPLAILSAKGAS
jgi:exopolysaccharide biosynthesis polyprenyl glycosylphosphotransferase